jgi:hypothetical protein
MVHLQSLKCTFETQAGTDEMNIFIEPVESPEGAKPVAQLTMTASHYRDNNPVTGERAVEIDDETCSSSLFFLRDIPSAAFP